MKYSSKIAFLLCILFMFLGGCVSHQNVTGESSNRKTIAVSTIGATHSWPEGVLFYAEEELKKIALENDWKYICVVANNTNEQSTQVIELIEQEVDCIIMLPMDGAALKTAAKAVQKSGIPLVIFDREIPDFAPTATVKGDNPGIGIRTAEIFNARFEEGAGVLELMGDASTVPFQRTAGYDETILDLFMKVQLGYTGWQRTQAKEMFMTFVQESTQEEIDAFSAIFTHDDEIALGILDALDAYANDTTFEKSFTQLKVIASSSGSQEMYNRILVETHFELFSLTYSPLMIIEAIRVGESIIKGEAYEEMTIVATVYVDHNNVEQFIDKNSPF